MSDHVDTLGTIVTIDDKVIKGIDQDCIPIPDGDTDDKDCSTLDSGYVKDKGLNMFDPGSCEVTGFMISGDEGQTALKNAYGDRKLHTIKVNVVEAGEIYEYQAYVTKFNPGSDDNSYKFSANFLASGAFKLSSSVAPITSIEGAGAGITYSPAAANSALTDDDDTVIFKEGTDVTTDTVEVTAATASYIGISVDEGATWTELTSGTAATIPAAGYPAAGMLKKNIIKVMQDQKATRFIKFYIARA